jgi:hypothetical protein
MYVRWIVLLPGIFSAFCIALLGALDFSDHRTYLLGADGMGWDAWEMIDEIMAI